MALSFQIGKYDGDRLVANKDIQIVGSVNGEVRGEIDMLAPTIVVESTAAIIDNCNYLIMSGDITRYFEITSKTAITERLFSLSCTADLRKTFLSAIRSSAGVVVRNTNNYNMYLPDSLIPTAARKNFSVYKFPHSMNRSTHTLSMLVVGGE